MICQGREEAGVGIRKPYIRVLGIQLETGGGGRTAVKTPFTPAEEEEFRRLAATPDVYETIASSVAPSIFGSVDIKKAIACLLFGGSRKRFVIAFIDMVTGFRYFSTAS